MKLITSLAVLALLASPQLLAKEPDHFQHIMFRETPFAPYAGIHPISAQQSDSVLHYEFSYDSQNRVAKISRKLGDKVVAMLGTWDSFIWFAPEVRITYLPKREVHTYFNTQGEQISAHGKVWQAIYELDNDGKRMALRFFDKAGEPTESEWGIHSYQWRASDDGHHFEKRFSLNGEQQTLRPELQFYEIKLEYDRNGQLAFMRNYGLNHRLTNNDSGAAIDRITYDLAGNFIRWQVYDKDNNPVEGNRPMVHLGEHLYDNNGNKIGMRGFDRFGKQIPFAWGVFQEAYDYNAVGAQTNARTFDANWQQQMHIETRYNQTGTFRTELIAYDVNGNKINDANLSGAAHIKFSLNDHGQVARSFFNADGKEIPPH